MKAKADADVKADADAVKAKADAEAVKAKADADVKAKADADVKANADVEAEPMDCEVLAVPIENPLMRVLVDLEDDAKVAQKKAETIEEKVDECIARQKTLAKDVPNSARKLKELEKMAGAVPHVKKLFLQHKLDHETLMKDKDRVAVGLELAKSKLKDARVNAAKLDKQVATIRSQMNRDEARLEEADKSDDEPMPCKSDKLTSIFDTMDRSGGGKVNKRDFIKALEYEDIALFFGLPSKILQEDGSRDLMEAAFQKIAIDGCEFDLEEFKAVHS